MVTVYDKTRLLLQIKAPWCYKYHLKYINMNTILCQHLENNDFEHCFRRTYIRTLLLMYNFYEYDIIICFHASVLYSIYTVT